MTTYDGERTVFWCGQGYTSHRLKKLLSTHRSSSTTIPYLKLLENRLETRFKWTRQSVLRKWTQKRKLTKDSEKKIQKNGLKKMDSANRIEIALQNSIADSFYPRGRAKEYTPRNSILIIQNENETGHRDGCIQALHKPLEMGAYCAAQRPLPRIAAPSTDPNLRYSKHQSPPWCTSYRFSPSSTALISFNTNTAISLGGPGKQK